MRPFVPRPLPPVPELAINSGSRLLRLLCEARDALGRVDIRVEASPNPELLTSAYITREALSSSMIEGTQSSIAEVMRFRALEALFDSLRYPDERDVNNCINALNFAQTQIGRDQNISMELLLEVHRRLLAGEGDENKKPGCLRTRQNYIENQISGKLKFVPPPAERVEPCMQDLLGFINDDEMDIDPLIRAGLAHVQFETIHPFADGNGRVGRILIYLILMRSGILKRPVLCLSNFLKERRARYYALLNETRSSGDWEGWLEFFLDAAVKTGETVRATSKRLDDLAASNDEKARGHPASVRRVHQAMLGEGIASIKQLMQKTELTHSTVSRSLSILQELNIVREITEQRRNRLFEYHEYMDILEESAGLVED